MTPDTPHNAIGPIKSDSDTFDPQNVAGAQKSGEVSLPKVLIVIPAFNEEETVAAIIHQLRDIIPEYDRVVVNDGSKDRTGEIVAELGEKQLLLPVNLGYGRAVQTGLRYALAKEYDIVVTFDADGQHRPLDVSRLVTALIEEAGDLVIGSRFSHDRRYDTPLERRLGQVFFSYLTRLLIGRRIFDTSSGFKALSRKAYEMISQAVFLDFHTETIVRSSMFGLKIIEVPIVVEERSFGQSMHSLASVIQYPMQTLVLTAVAVMDAFIKRRTQ
jgi:glycosyltransferase involved in cell wall biosynthesis